MAAATQVGASLVGKKPRRHIGADTERLWRAHDVDVNEPQLEWGDKVLVARAAGPETAAWVCGRRESQGEWLYIVEYEDGSSDEVPERNLRRS